MNRGSLAGQRPHPRGQSPRRDGERVPPGVYVARLGRKGKGAQLMASGAVVWRGGWTRLAAWVQRKQGREAPEHGALAWEVVQP